MNDWNIGPRIALGFAAVIAIAITLGLFAYSRVAAIDERANEITMNALPIVYMVGQIQNHAESEFVALLRHAGSRDGAEMAPLESEIEAGRATNARIREAYQKLIHTDRGRELFEVTKAARVPMQASFSQVLELSRTGKKDQAQALLNRELIPLFQKYEEAATALAAGSKEASDASGGEIRSSVGNAKTGILVGLALALLVAAGIAAVITRGITEPLRKAVELIGGVSQGDLNNKAEVQSRDELGRMIAGMNGM